MKIKDVKNKNNDTIQYQYALDYQLEMDLRNLQQKRLSPRAYSIEKNRLLDLYYAKSVFNRINDKEGELTEDTD